ncbi:MAG: hypothetical protein ACI8SE_000921 [Bacteroidia bacterium]|jgi:hypothetical protein
MIYAEEVEIESVFLHQIGNKSLEEGCTFSEEPLQLSPKIESALKQYFFDSFEDKELYHLDHDVDIKLNEVYSYVSKIFNGESTLKEQASNIARHLYRCSDHPNIKPGDLCIALLRDCQIEGQVLDAVGIFKAENKETFLKVIPQGNQFSLESDEGIAVGKLDKGCLIFNTDEEEGYLVTVVDQTNKGVEARFWSDEFLHLKHRRDIYFNTQNVMEACKTFVSEALPVEYTMEKADQMDLLNKSISYFKENDRFVQEEFEGAVFKDPDVIQSFKAFNTQFADENDMDMPQSFEISKDAVKKKSRVFKSVLKLDKNFHVYVHGNRDKIERGVDPDGRKFYKLYYDNEQ